MRQQDTAMGGARGTFQTTRWSEIGRAQAYSQADHTAVEDTLLQRYWKPIYCYLRRKGYKNEAAKDLTQGFFHEIVLGKELFQKADQSKGRLRTFLLTALDRYVISMNRKETAQKRRPSGGITQLDTDSFPEIPAVESNRTPEHTFHYTWATNILDRVLDELKEEYCNTGRPMHWALFHDRILKPIFDDTTEPSLSEICQEYGIESKKKAANMVITVKRRFASVLRRVLREFVQSDDGVEEEIRGFVEVLSTGGAA